MRSVSHIGLCIACLAFFAAPTRSQTVDDVRREIDQLKKDYEARIKALEDRLASLEKDQTATKQDVAATKQLRIGPGLAAS